MNMRTRCCVALVPLLAGGMPSLSEAQIQVSVRAEYPAEALFITDLTPSGRSSTVDVLGVTLVNPGSRAETVELELSVFKETPSRSAIFSGTTAAFSLAPGVRSLTSSDLFTRGKDVSITDYSIGESAEYLRDLVGQTGRLPAGNYLFVVEVRRPQGVVLGRGDLRWQLSNPTRVELVAPGTPLGLDPATVNTSGLRFVWTTDAATAQSLYTIRVVKTDGAVSGEEAMQGQAAWESTLSGTSALYPASASALRLEPGATYAWQVTREVRSSFGVELIQSPIYWFRAGGSGDRTASASADDAFALRLAELLKTVGLRNELAGYRPVRARLADGSTISLESLQEVLSAIAGGDMSLVSIRVR